LDFDVVEFDCAVHSNGVIFEWSDIPPPIFCPQSKNQQQEKQENIFEQNWLTFG
jgi:hypothetical protein